MDQQIKELRDLAIKTSQDMGEIKGQLLVLSDVNRKLDHIGDIAKEAKSSTESAHKRLNDIVADVKEADRKADGVKEAIQVAGGVKERQDKLDSRIWAIVLAVVGILIKMFFDLFNNGGTGTP